MSRPGTPDWDATFNGAQVRYFMAKLDEVCEFYGIKTNPPDRLQRLAIELLFAHVPAFRPTDNQVGRPRRLPTKNLRKRRPGRPRDPDSAKAHGVFLRQALLLLDEEGPKRRTQRWAAERIVDEAQLLRGTRTPDSIRRMMVRRIERMISKEKKRLFPETAEKRPR